MIKRRYNSKQYDEKGRRRDGSPTQRKRTFTPEMWDRWHEERKPDADTPRLKAGIEQMRNLLERKYDRKD